MFKGQLHYKTLVGGELWQLEKPLIYEWVQTDYLDIYIKERRVIIPAGYVTDFYSIPSWMRWKWPKDIDPVHPAILHDYLYTHAQQSYTRLQADLLFYRAMNEVGVSVGRRNAFYLAVRLGGKRTWYKRINRRVQYLRSIGIEPMTNGQPLELEHD